MIPRNLPRIAYNAVDRGWNVIVNQPVPDNPFTDAEFRRGYTAIALAWDMDGWLAWATVNGTETPYAQCARLILSEADQ